MRFRFVRSRANAIISDSTGQVFCRHVGVAGTSSGILLINENDFLVHPNTFFVEVVLDKENSEKCHDNEVVALQPRKLAAEHGMEVSNTLNIMVPSTVHVRHGACSFAVLVDYDLTADCLRNPTSGWISGIREDNSIIFRIPYVIVPPKESERLEFAPSDTVLRKVQTCAQIRQNENLKLAYGNLWHYLDDAVLLSPLFAGNPDSKILQLIAAKRKREKKAAAERREEMVRSNSSRALHQQSANVESPCTKCGGPAATSLGLQVAKICAQCKQFMRMVL